MRGRKEEKRKGRERGRRREGGRVREDRRGEKNKSNSLNCEWKGESHGHWHKDMPISVIIRVPQGIAVGWWH